MKQIILFLCIAFGVGCVTHVTPHQTIPPNPDGGVLDHLPDGKAQDCTVYEPCASGLQRDQWCKCTQQPRCSKVCSMNTGKNNSGTFQNCFKEPVCQPLEYKWNGEYHTVESCTSKFQSQADPTGNVCYWGQEFNSSN